MVDIALPIDSVAGAPLFPAAQNRVADAALMAGRTDRSLGAVSGIRPGADPVVTITPARVWTVTPTNGVVDPETASTVGPYRFAFTANKTGTLDAADASYTRYDRIDLQVPDDPAGASPLVPVYIVTKGVPAASPAVPAAPARSFPIGVFTVPNSGNPSFAATWPYCVASGGIIPTRAGYRPASPYVGQYIDDAATGLKRWDGTAWRDMTVRAMAAGARPNNPYVGQYIDDANSGLLRYDGTNWVRPAFKFAKSYTNTNIGATTSSTVLDTGVLAAPILNLPFEVEVTTYVAVQTLAANQAAGVLVRFWDGAGAELQRVEGSVVLQASATTVGVPIANRYVYPANSSYRVTVEVLRRAGAGNISATPANQTQITVQPVILLP